MCSTVIFRYKCGCAERVVFECSFSSTTNSNASSSLRALSHQNCARRYRLHQEELFPPNKATLATVTPTPPSHQALPQSLGTDIQVPPSPKPTCPKTEKSKEQKAGETTVTELDESCHDCWQSDLQLAKQRDDDDTSSLTSMKDDEKDVRNLANTRILREKPLNELILPPPSPPIITDSGATSSTGSFSRN
ncbi:hypothetical protein F4803DRAFT_553326 [Xylaria telfairii]|nr:hypothetical protein F4803DRAFT_553326 [Xylaria telfairii]